MLRARWVSVFLTLAGCAANSYVSCTRPAECNGHQCCVIYSQVHDADDPGAGAAGRVVALGVGGARAR